MNSPIFYNLLHFSRKKNTKNEKIKITFPFKQSSLQPQRCSKPSGGLVEKKNLVLLVWDEAEVLIF